MKTEFDADAERVIEAFWAALRPGGEAAGEGLDLAAMRRGYESFSARIPLPPGTSVEPSAGVAGEWVVPAGTTRGVVLHVHGGGHALGSPRTHRPFAAELAAAAAVRVLVPDFRLAPEHPHPAALEDVVAAYRSLLAEGTSPAEILFCGDSSGGGVALAALMAARDRDLPLPAGAMLISPWTDLPCERGSRVELRAQDPISSVEGFAMLTAMVAAGGDPADPSLSPVFGEFAGLPPLLVQVCERELLLDDAKRTVARASEAGVAAELEVWPRMFHNFQLFSALFPPGHDARRAVDALAAFAQRALDRPAP